MMVGPPSEEIQTAVFLLTAWFTERSERKPLPEIIPSDRACLPCLLTAAGISERVEGCGNPTCPLKNSGVNTHMGDPLPFCPAKG